MGWMNVLAALSMLVTAVYGLPTGAPSTACDTLTPSHGTSNPVNTTSPFSIDLSPFSVSGSPLMGYWYMPGQTYTLNLMDRMNTSNTFRGFLVQSRVMADDSTRVGMFGVINSTLAKLGPCAPTASSITHTNNMDKTEMYMNWTAPATGTGAVRFAYAVVQTRHVWWADLRSAPLQELPPSPGSNCTGVQCGAGEMCILPYPDAPTVCVCSYGYVYNPNTGVCEMGEVNLPIRLNPTVVMYRGMCSALNTDSERSNITQAVSNTLVKSIVYNSNITGPP